MKFCSHCGSEIMEEAVICVHCGCKVESGNTGSDKKTMKLLIKIFMILGCVASAFAWLIPLCWTIPMTVSLCRKLDRNEPVSTGFKVCTLIFCNLIAGILLLVTDTEEI